MNSLMPYTALEGTNDLHIEDVPYHWVILPLCAIAKPKAINNQCGRELLSVYLNHGVVPFRSIKEKRTNVTSEDLSKYQAVDPGDFVLNNQQAWRGSVGVSMHQGIVSPAYLVLSLGPRINPKFANLLFRERSMVAQYLIASKGVGSIQRNLYWPHLKRIPIILPPLNEQAAIVLFLDHADRKIRRYIRAKQKLIKLLEEQKQVIIHRAVTRGLDPNVSLKPSGVEWLGDVPEHWELRRLKMICSMKSGEGITAESIEPAGQYPVYGGNGIRGYTTTFTHDGDFILVGRQGALCGNVHLAAGRFWASEHAVVTTHSPGNNIGWFSELIRAMNLNQYSIAAAQPGLAVERILNLTVPVPPPLEQARISAHTSQATLGLEEAIERPKDEIALLREYRTRLFADVVTGKLDVREAASQLPHEDQELPPIDRLDEISDSEDDDHDGLDQGSEDPEP